MGFLSTPKFYGVLLPGHLILFVRPRWFLFKRNEFGFGCTRHDFARSNRYQIPFGRSLDIGGWLKHLLPPFPETKLAQVSRMGNKVLEFRNADLAFGDDKVILKDFNYEFKRGDRIGIVGGNGVGKTTFLRVLMQLQELDHGEVIIGETVVFGYYNQAGTVLPEKKRVVDYVQEVCGAALNNVDMLSLMHDRFCSTSFPFHVV